MSCSAPPRCCQARVFRLATALAIVTNGGGLGVLTADALAHHGGRLASLNPQTITALGRVVPPSWSRANPVDIIGDADGARYASAVDAVLGDPAVDAALVLYCPTAVSDPLDAAERTIAAARRNAKPILAAWVGDASVATARAAFAAARIPSFAAPEDAVTAFGRLNTFRKRRALLMETPDPAAPIDAAARERAAKLLAEAPHGGWLRGLEAKQVAETYGIAVNRTVFAPTPDAAAAAADRLSGRLALKIVSPDIVHKSNVGGVALNLDGRDAVLIAARAMLERVRTGRPSASVTGFLVEQMIVRRHAHELFLGTTVDPTFGPVIAFGHGGTAVEILDDKALGLPPLNLNLARAMIQETRIWRLLQGYRDRPPADTESIARAIVGLSALVADHPSIVDIDVNPLLADEDGVIAVDVRIRVTADQRPGLVIAPYPAHLSREIATKTGHRLWVRPIRPEDEPALRRFVARLAPEDMRFRFFLPLRSLDHPLAARLTQIDYDREIAFVAAAPDAPEEFWGVVRLHADPDNARAEFAVTVRPDKKGLGLGTALMGVMLDEARRRGVGAVWGDVLTDNGRMLTLARDLGFPVTPIDGDSSVVKATMVLR
jgi:acetyltransferase